MNEIFSNVWDALFDDPGEKAVLEIKSGLMDEIRHYLKRENLTQEKAAEILGVNQPRISDISTGKISKFTVDALVSILAKAGIVVEVRPKKNKLINVPPQTWNRSHLRLIETGGNKKKPVGEWSVTMPSPSIRTEQENTFTSDGYDEYALEA
jgi:predicted XRE-type DNA-binding protein